MQYALLGWAHDAVDMWCRTTLCWEWPWVCCQCYLDDLLHNLGVNLRVATPWAIFAWIQEQRRRLSSQLLLLLPLLLELLLSGLSQSAQAVSEYTAELRS